MRAERKKDALEERTKILLLTSLFLPFSLIIRLNPKSYPNKSRAWSSIQRRDLVERKKKFFFFYLVIDCRYWKLKIFTRCTNVTVDLVERGRKYKFHSFKAYAKAIKNIGRFSIKKRTMHAKKKNLLD